MSQRPTTAPTPAAPPLGATAARDHRSMLLFLAATDPLGLLDGGHPVDHYASTASIVLQVLASGGGVDEIFELFVTASNRVEAVDAFTRVALDWRDQRAWPR